MLGVSIQVTSVCVLLRPSDGRLTCQNIMQFCLVLYNAFILCQIITLLPDGDHCVVFCNGRGRG